MKTQIRLEKAVFLDFDGVLFDTVKEAYVVCSLAAKKIKKAEEAEFDSEDFRVFEKYRYLIGPAWNYYYLLKAADVSERGDGIEIKYLDYISAAREAEYSVFEKTFFAVRDDFKKTNEKLWFDLNSPYAFLAKIYPFIKKFPRHFFIVTTKDRPTVLKLIKKQKMKFNAENIYDRDSFKRFSTKGGVIKNIMKDREIYNAVFIDDSIGHIKECQGVPGLTILQPRWGYVSSKEAGSSEQEIISAMGGLLKGV